MVSVRKRLSVSWNKKENNKCLTSLSLRLYGHVTVDLSNMAEFCSVIAEFTILWSILHAVAGALVI